MSVLPPRMTPLVAGSLAFATALALAISAALIFTPASQAVGPGELFVDADDLSCTDDPSESAGESGTPFCSIQAAIDFIEETTPTGGKITLRAAVYDEGTITTNHGDFSIRGDPAVLRSSIVIRPSGDSDIGIHVTDPLGVCDNFSIQHVTIDGSGHHANGPGILVDDVCEPITISDVEVSGWTEEGILFADSSGDEAATATDNSSISTSIVRDNGRAGIELHDGTGNLLEDVDVSGNGAEGIALFTEVNARITHSTVTSNGFHGIADFEGTNTRIVATSMSGNVGHGLFATGPHSGLRVEDNSVLNNAGSGLVFVVGLFGEGGTHTEISGNDIEGNGSDGMYAVRQDDLTLIDNTMAENGGAGLVLDEGADITVLLNDLDQNGAQGLFAVDQTDLMVRSNSIDQNGSHGVQLGRGDDNVVLDNSISGNAESGLRADDMLRLRISESSIVGNGGIGLELLDGTSTMVSLNAISDNADHGVVATRELVLSLMGNDVSENEMTGIRLVSGTNGSVIANVVEDNGVVGSAEDYGISVNGETDLVIEKNTLRRNLDGQLIIDSSSDVRVQKNDFVTAVDGILLVDTLAHPFTGLVIGGSAENRNRFRGLDPATNACDVPDDACYIEIPQLIVGKGTINATFNDWGTTNLDLIENLVCHAGESPCGSNVVDFSSPQTPGDSPADKVVVGALTGDADCSGAVNSIDGALILQFSAALLSTLPCEDAADANGDGSVNSLDAALVLQFTAGLLTSL